MDPNVFFGALLSALIAGQSPAIAGVVCDRRGFCVEQPQFARPYYPPPPVYVPPQPQALNQTKDALGEKVKNEIYEFCSRHPEEKMCVDLEQYLQQHPNAR